jgi:hypothetical protein
MYSAILDLFHQAETVIHITARADSGESVADLLLRPYVCSVSDHEHIADTAPGFVAMVPRGCASKCADL